MLGFLLASFKVAMVVAVDKELQFFTVPVCRIHPVKGGEAIDVAAYRLRLLKCFPAHTFEKRHERMEHIPWHQDCFDGVWIALETQYVSRGQRYVDDLIEK